MEIGFEGPELEVQGAEKRAEFLGLEKVFMDACLQLGGGNLDRLEPTLHSRGLRNTLED